MGVTAKDVAELRKLTGVGMMECKSALTETDGDIEKAIVVLREKGLATQAKKAGRVSAEGIVKAIVKGEKGAVVEINSETDFVAKNEDFIAFANDVANTVLETNPSDLEALKATKISGGTVTVAEALQELFLRIRENLQLRRFAKLDGKVVSYVHAGGKIGVIVKLDTTIASDNEGLITVGKDIAMQIAALNPTYLAKEEIAPETLAQETVIARQKYAQEVAEKKEENERLEGEIRISEKEIEKNKEDPKRVTEEEDLIKKFKKEISKNLGFINKPAQVIENNIIPGKVNNFVKEVTLLEQTFVKAEQGESVAKYLETSGKKLGGEIKIAEYIRYELGEGIEKRKDDFAAEVASLAKGE
ncbi:elongation factor Ts [Clostridia bacterium]|nr:elongation factor Ts [Clostridia bacterium]